MKRLLVALVCLACITLPGRIVAQDAAQPAAAAATPDPLVWDDSAMHLVVPSGYVLLRRMKSVALDDLGNDPAVVAQWLPTKPPLRKLSLSMASFTGSTDAWQESYTQYMRDQHDDLLTSDKTQISLKNGMPAYFLAFTFGSGFDTEKEFAVIWADGQRGLAFTEDSRVDEVSDKVAKADLMNITAVEYPINEP